MDILVSSNLERLLFLASGCNAEAVSKWMADLSSDGLFKVDEKTIANIKETFLSYSCNEEQTIAEIGEVYSKYGYLCDPHTAVGMKVADDYKKLTNDYIPTVVLSTASPYKFPAPVSQAIGLKATGDEFEQIDAIFKATGVPVPENLSSIRTKRVLHDDVIDRNRILDYVLDVLGI